MKLNKVLDYYYRSYNKAASGKEEGRATINAVKRAAIFKNKPGLYQAIRAKLIKLLAGPFYWQNTFPSGIDEGVAYTLYSLVRLVRPQVIIEIGTAYGNSTIAIAQGLEDNGTGFLYTMDPFEQEIVGMAIKKSGLGHRVRYDIGYSYDVIPKLEVKAADMIFVDGSHEPEDVAKDFSLVKNLVRKGGLLVFHDTMLFKGPRDVIAKIENGGEFQVLTLPTITGLDDNERPTLAPFAHGGFSPVGLTICKRN